MKEMKHKNVVEMFEVCDVGWMTCIFMELCSGGDLLGVRVSTKPVSFSEEFLRPSASFAVELTATRCTASLCAG